MELPPALDEKPMILYTTLCMVEEQAWFNEQASAGRSSGEAVSPIGERGL